MKDQTKKKRAPRPSGVSRSFPTNVKRRFFPNVRMNKAALLAVTTMLNKVIEEVARAADATAVFREGKTMSDLDIRAGCNQRLPPGLAKKAIQAGEEAVAAILTQTEPPQ